MKIRKATDADISAIAKIHRASRHHALSWLPTLHTPEDDYWFFSKMVFTSEAMWVASNDQKIVGFVSFKDDWLNHLYVAPDHWRRNIGASLLECAKSSTDRLQLWTFQQNISARRFYLANEFQEWEHTDGQRNEEKTPDLRMEWGKPR